MAGPEEEVYYGSTGCLWGEWKKIRLRGDDEEHYVHDKGLKFNPINQGSQPVGCRSLGSCRIVQRVQESLNAFVLF